MCLLVWYKHEICEGKEKGKFFEEFFVIMSSACHLERQEKQLCLLIKSKGNAGKNLIAPRLSAKWGLTNVVGVYDT
jgi:hypothetical protein